LTNLYCNNDRSEKKGRWIEQSINDVRRVIGKTLDPNKMNERQVLIRGAEYSDADIYRMYQEFQIHVFPSQYMNYASFIDYTLKLGFYENERGKKESPYYFNAFRGDDVWLTFEDFCVGMAAAEKATPHGGIYGKKHRKFSDRCFISFV